MALCRQCSTPTPCHCHLNPPAKTGPNVYLVEERYPANRPGQDQDVATARQDGAAAVSRRLNACGFSVETIAAEYETDAALTEADQDMSDPYFLAALAAETEHRTLDWQSSRTEGAGS
ncbi:hypothetical protein ACIQSP_16585 [Streptomyces nigra]|uniref:hypothetical protein n=1 Tax=Streptomyces nigra TaxID=1827580 RepID=UPI003828DC1E